MIDNGGRSSSPPPGGRSRWRVHTVPAKQVAEDRRALNTTSSPLYVGTGFDLSPSSHFEGLVDELVIFHRALPASDVATLFGSY